MNQTTNGKIISQEQHVEELSQEHYLTVKDLKKTIANLDDNTLISMERIEDHYFRTPSGWKTLKLLQEEKDISHYSLEKMQILKDKLNRQELDPTLHKIIEREGKTYFQTYCDALPVFNGYTLKINENGQLVLFLTPHY